MPKFFYNPLSGTLDLVGSSGGGGGSSTGYAESFANEDWVLSGGKYQIVVNEATHQMGVNPVAQVFELSGGIYSEVTVDELLIDNSGLVTIKVLSSPDLRFQGKLIIR